MTFLSHVINIIWNLDLLYLNYVLTFYIVQYFGSLP